MCLNDLFTRRYTSMLESTRNELASTQSELAQRTAFIKTANDELSSLREKASFIHENRYICDNCFIEQSSKRDQSRASREHKKDGRDDI